MVVPDVLGRAAARRLGSVRQSDAGSGTGGTRLEQWNFDAIEVYMRARRVCVRVFSAESMDTFGFQAGRRVAWVLGEGDGACVGSLEWLDSGRACAVRGGARGDVLEWGTGETAPRQRQVAVSLQVAAGSGAPRQGTEAARGVARWAGSSRQQWVRA
eukprot:4565793-Pyramimonas_sp.AAC.1